MSAEIQQLRQTLANSGASNASTSPQCGQDIIVRPVEAVTWESQVSGTSDGTAPSPAHFSTSLSVNSIPLTSGPLTDQDRTLGNVCLTQGQVEKHFKTYFARHHRYLPFKVSSELPEELYMRSTLLFWVICAVTSSWKQQTQLSPMIKPMIAASIHVSSYSVETIQALLIMCIWPFKTARLSEDPSKFYSSIAAQMSLQLGLHRPSQPYWPLQHGSLSGPLTAADKEVRLTTWLSCYLINQMQSSAHGVPSSILVDANLLDAFDNPSVDRDLAQLCHIYHMLTRLTWEIGANAPSPVGIIEPEARIPMIRYYLEQMSALEGKHLAQASDAVRISFLYSKLQLLSFALLDDVPFSESLLDLIKDAEGAAGELVDITSEMNLAATPTHIRRAMCYGAFVLIRILQLPHETQRELLVDIIERVRESLSTTATAPDDVICKACTILQEMPFLENKHRSPPILSRMGASIFYDTFRVYWENLVDRGFNFEPEKYDWWTLGL